MKVTVCNYESAKPRLLEFSLENILSPPVISLWQGMDVMESIKCLIRT
jgi:hypothetical protein